MTDRITLQQIQSNLDRAITYGSLRLTQEVLRDTISYIIEAEKRTTVSPSTLPPKPQKKGPKQ